VGSISDLHAAESEAQRQIELRLGPLVTLADEMNCLFERAIDAVAEHPRPGDASEAATKVSLILAARLANDLRVCSIASRFGYGLQAMGLAATMVEVVGALSYVGDSDARAHEWAEHTDRKKTYPPRVRDGVDEALTALGIKEPAARDQWQRVYASLCMAKHANPMLSMQQGLRILPDGAYFVCGPDASQLGANMSCFALYHAVGFGSAALYVFARCCSNQKLQAQLRDDAHRIRNQLLDLEPLLVGLMAAPPTSPV
jgi:hypothetical protein